MTQATQSLFAMHDGEKLFLAEGILSELQVVRTTVNLLAQIETHNRAKGLASGVVGAVSSMLSSDSDAYATAIFKALGFPRPNDIDLTRVGSMNHEKTG